MVRDLGAINLGQGICDMPVPQEIKAAAKEAIDADRSIYTSYAGIRRLRSRIADKVRNYNHIDVPSEEEIVVSAGSTGAFATAIFAILDPGDEALLFEPFYGYHRNLIRLTGATPRSVPMHGRSWTVDFDEVEAAIGPRTKLIVVNTPGNPSGKVWSRGELARLLELAGRNDLFVITDEIYEYMVYDGREHVSLASLPGAYERVVTVSGFSKTFNMTGWRLGYAVAPAALAEKMGLLNDLFYICAPSPLQYALADAELPGDYFLDLRREYERKREMMMTALMAAGMEVLRPEGAYYVLADFRGLSSRVEGFSDDATACETLVREAGVASIPGSAFFDTPDAGKYLLRFCYAKKHAELEEACRRLIAFGNTIAAETAVGRG